MDNNLLNVKQACDALDTSRATLYRHLKSGALPSIRVFGRVYVKRTTIETLLNEGTAQ
ncbi:excisionase family DNA binding protein [Skermanella aerolata]|uniref:helix-turn-helix domain-containing protein n=1 Tax=Skermanella aerolata TaxID=393310 RepID=UPI003D2538B3